MDGLVNEIADGVQLLRIDRVEAQNGMTSEMCEAAADALSFAESSSRARVVLLTGVPGLFTIGIDPGDLEAYARTGVMGESVVRLFKTIATVDIPVIAAVDGVVAGAGAALLFHCDYVVASEWVNISLSYADHGLPPESGLSLLAPLQIGYQAAFGLLAMGDSLDAEQALRIGLVNRVVPAEDVESAGLDAARNLASKPPEAVRIARRMMRGDPRSTVMRIDAEAKAFTDLLRSPAARDALKAYLSRIG